jgi:hypothetical protein
LRNESDAGPKCFDGIEPEQNEGAIRLMARKLKTYQTSLGFFEQAVAAPSMKAALEAWGADSNLFHQGAAQESTDPDVIAATMAKPGVVLKRPVGSSGPFKEHAELPRDIAGDGGAKKTDRKVGSGRPQKHAKKTVDEAADRKASLAFEKEKERERRERERAKEEAAQRKERERRQEAVDRAQAALDTARRTHDGNAADIQAKLEALEERSRTEEARWEKERSKLEALLRRARG